MPHDDRCNRYIICRKAKRHFSLRSSEPGLRKSDPACPQSGGAGRQHQVFSRKRTVLNGPRALRCARDHDERGRMMENIELGIAQNFLEMM